MFWLLSALVIHMHKGSLHLIKPFNLRLQHTMAGAPHSPSSNYWPHLHVMPCPCALGTSEVQARCLWLTLCCNCKATSWDSFTFHVAGIITSTCTGTSQITCNEAGAHMSAYKH